VFVGSAVEVLDGLAVGVAAVVGERVALGEALGRLLG
jgi:hypothetical protein